MARKTESEAQIADNLKYLVHKRTTSKTNPKTLVLIARDAGMDRTTLWRLMNAERGISEEKLLALAKSLGCKPWRLLVKVRNPEEKYPNVDVPVHRKKLVYSRIEGPMRSDKQLARFFGGMSEETMRWLRPSLEKMVDYIGKQREADVLAGRYDRKRPLY